MSKKRKEKIARSTFYRFSRFWMSSSLRPIAVFIDSKRRRDVAFRAKESIFTSQPDNSVQLVPRVTFLRVTMGFRFNHLFFPGFFTVATPV